MATEGSVAAHYQTPQLLRKELTDIYTSNMHGRNVWKCVIFRANLCLLVLSLLCRQAGAGLPQTTDLLFQFVNDTMMDRIKAEYKCFSCKVVSIMLRCNSFLPSLLAVSCHSSPQTTDAL